MFGGTSPPSLDAACPNACARCPFVFLIMILSGGLWTEFLVPLRFVLRAYCMSVDIALCFASPRTPRDARQWMQFRALHATTPMDTAFCTPRLLSRPLCLPHARGDLHLCLLTVSAHGTLAT
jgi:hypothetical protein